MAQLGFSWTTCVILGAGALVAFFVLHSPRMYRRWRYPLTDASREEDLPWDELLLLLEQHRCKRAADGLPHQEPTEQELDRLLERLPDGIDSWTVEPEDRAFAAAGGDERRAGRRRWGNPIEVYVRAHFDLGSASLDELLLGRSPATLEPLHALIINRSTGGVAIYVDTEVPPDTIITIRAVEAPKTVPSVWAEVRHCRKASKGFVLGCQFTRDVPWNVRVWFG